MFIAKCSVIFAKVASILNAPSSSTTVISTTCGKTSAGFAIMASKRRKGRRIMNLVVVMLHDIDHFPPLAKKNPRAALGFLFGIFSLSFGVLLLSICSVMVRMKKSVRLDLESSIGTGSGPRMIFVQWLQPTVFFKFNFEFDISTCVDSVTEDDHATEEIEEKQRNNAPSSIGATAIEVEIMNSGLEGISEVKYIESENLKDVEYANMTLKMPLAGVVSKNWVSECEAINNVPWLSVLHKETMCDKLENVSTLIVKSLKNSRSRVCKTVIMTSMVICKAYGEYIIVSLHPKQPYLKNKNPRIQANALMCFSRSVPRLYTEDIKIGRPIFHYGTIDQ